MSDLDVTSPDPGRARPASGSGLDGRRFAPGVVLAGRYRIVGPLGRGGMGEVYRADDLTLGQAVALKFLPEGVDADPVRRERFLDEVRTARQVSHPNVCRVHDVADVDGRHFLSMEYVDGEDLSSLLRRIGRLPPDKGLEIARQICAGLAASHDRGVLHRDLKPANVMLDGQGKVRITDFGLATSIAAASGGEIAGTPAYMAPEQLAGEPLSPQTDLYAVGLLLYEIFTGRRVNDVSSVAELRERHRQPAAAALSSSGGALDPAVERVIERCLERDPRKRPASAIAVAAALPGGDPLAAALAAGETPSPQMVAAAGDAGGLSPLVAIPCLIGVFVGLLVYTWLNGRWSYPTRVAMELAPEVLTTKAQDLLARLGYSDRPVDTARGFVERAEYPAWLDEHDRSPSRWQYLATVQPPVVAFWYRGSPRWLSLTGGGIVFKTDPALDISGMTYVELRPDGRLVQLDVIPPQTSEPSGSPPRPFEWTRLFAEAGLDPQRFTATEPTWLGHGYADSRAAWRGPSPDGSGVELRIEAAAYQGKPVFFRIIAPWTRAERMVDIRIPSPNLIVTSAFLTLFLGVLAVAVVIARHNIRLGRGDRQGAIRLAVASLSGAFGGLMLRWHHVATFSEVAAIATALSLAVLEGVLVGLLYVAVEPYVRRRWPQSLISWTRLLSGRWRDPLVGRDLLLGSLAGFAIAVLEYGEALVGDWLGRPPSGFDRPDWIGLTMPLPAVGLALGHAASALLLSMLFLSLLLLLRVGLRREVVASAVFVVIWIAFELFGVENVWVALPFFGLAGLLTVLVLTRLGLLAFTASWYVNSLGFGVLSFRFSNFYRDTMIAIMILTIAPAVFGFYTSLAKRPLLSGRLLEE